MKLFGPPARSSSAPVARERLQLLLAHDRASIRQPDLVAMLREEILGVIAKHLGVARHKILVKMERSDSVSTLEIDLEFPTRSKMPETSAPELAAVAAA